MYLSLIETAEVEEEDEVYNTKTALSWTKSVFVISRRLSFTESS